ncbi:hypothetical protein [Halodurantibacterium flavum]|uniref:Methyltransferase domain-containing protein n=1 Tax=Halodurantibacterium flavum TaxID=1382802 RepID=A0ABW4S2P1_9RHOB
MKKKISLSPDVPCGCNSGLPYGECHQPIFDAPKEEMLVVSWRIYAESWATNADHYRVQGVYANLAGQIANAGDIRRVLDIGTGRGHGLAALRDVLPPDIRIVGVDENPECLAAAAQLLGIDALPTNIRRAENSVLPNGYLISTYPAGNLIDQGSITLIQSDVIVRDSALERLLNAAGSFDAVCLWFNGVHKARSATEIARHFEVKSDADNRTLVEDRVLSIAAERLRPGGILHLVNRIATIDIEATGRAIAQTYRDWLEDMPFQLEAIGAFRYEEPTGGVLVRSADLGVNEMPNYALSMLFRRR